MTLFNIDALFQKEFRLQTFTNAEDWESYNALVTPIPSYSLVIGKSLSGKTTISNLIAKHAPGVKVWSLRAIEAEIKKSKGTEEEPYEGEVTLDEIQ